MTNIMQGFPVPRDQRVPHLEWDRAPWNRWTFQHVREYVPTTEVWRGKGPVSALESHPRDLSQVTFDDAEGQASTVQQWINSSYTDSILVLHRGAIILEQYHNGMEQRTLHLSQSMAKSVVSTVAGILIGRGVI